MSVHPGPFTQAQSVAPSNYLVARESWSNSGVIGVQSGLCGTDSLSFPLSLHCAMLVSFQLTQGSVIGFLAFFFFSLDLRLLKMKLEFTL